MSKTSTRNLALLLLILLLGAASRIIGIDAQSIWIDEGFTWHFTQYPDPMRILFNDVHPPLYFYVVDVWVDIVGQSVVAMRFFSVLPSVLSIAVIYQLAREIEKQAGFDTYGVFPLIAALIMALMDAENYLAKEIRSYTWHVLFASLSMWGFLRWVRVGRWRKLGLWVSSTIALVYVFYLGAFIGVVQGIYALLFLNVPNRGYVNRKRITAISALIISALALVPWLAYTLPEQSGNLSYAEWIRPDAFDFWLINFRNQYFGQQWALMIGLLIVGFALLRDDKGWQLNFKPVVILLLLWLGLPLLLTVAANEFAPLYQPRRVTQIVPAIALLIALGITQFPPIARRFLLVVILVYGVTTVDFTRYKQPWRTMVAETAPYIAPATPILFELGGDDYAPRYHYAEALPYSHDTLLRQQPANNQSVPLVGLTTWRNLEPETYAGGLPPYINSLEHLWLFYWSSDTGALNWLDTFGFTRTGVFTVDFNPDVYLYRYDKLPETPVASFDNGMILQDALLHDDSLLVELFWTSDTPLTENYTVSVFLEDANGQRVAQVDSQPFLNERPTTSWAVNEPVYDPKRLIAENSLPSGDYRVNVLLYNSNTGERMGSDDREVITIGTITLAEAIE